MNPDNIRQLLEKVRKGEEITLEMLLSEDIEQLTRQWEQKLIELGAEDDIMLHIEYDWEVHVEESEEQEGGLLAGDSGLLKLWPFSFPMEGEPVEPLSNAWSFWTWRRPFTII